MAVLVWSTVELAKGHKDHRSKLEDMQIRGVIDRIVKYYFDLEVGGKDELDVRELKEAMDVSFMRKDFELLKLPNNFGTDMIGLFNFLDQHNEGVITVKQLHRGLTGLKTPAKRFDYAKLAANL